MFKNKKVILVLLSLLFMVSFVACGNKNTTNGGNTTENKKEEVQQEVKETTYPLTVKDSSGREVVIESEPKTVVSLAPSITEIIYALGKGDTLVGRTTYCNYPEEATKVEEIGTLMEPNVEKITSIKPDLIIGSTHLDEKIVKQLEELGMKIVYINESEDIEGSYKTITSMGEILNANEVATKTVDEMKTKIDAVVAKVKESTTKPSVYYVVGFDFTAGKDTFISQLIELAGGKNAADDVEGWSYSIEKLVEKNPDIMITDNALVEEVKTKEFYKDLTAVKNGQLYGVNGDIFSRQGSPRLAEAVEELAKIIHPELFK